ncbi:hypothetical protein DRO19_02065 [Candidatus Bathyarchaeota archaeon]|nr:MAG: hypothetical protein DRO19_02065 [Candidatus Bathyarchaeota archaeon]
MPRGLLKAYAIRKPAFTFTIDDLMHVKDSSTMRLTASPFVHNYEDVVFLGHAAPWKGKKGIEKVREINPDVAAGLEKAIEISQECEGVKGVVRVGDRWLPKKVICQIEKAAEKKGKAE